MSISGPKPSAFYIERQAKTRSPATPTAPANLDGRFAAGQIDPGPGNATPGDGLMLAGLMSLTVSIYPNPGTNITGGSVLCVIYNPYQAQWTRCPDDDLTITAGTYTTGYTFAPLRNISRLGMLINFLTSGITGTTGDVLVRIDGFTSVLGMSS